MRRLSSFLVLTFLIFFSCQNSKENQPDSQAKIDPKIDSLYKLVVAKHDEVMPKTSDISKLTQQLRKRLEIEKSETEKEKILNLLAGLQSANDAMFDWMGEFKGLHNNKEYYEKTDEKELSNYLKSEEIKIERVAKLMLESIGYAELFLKESKQ
jgi:hypothetical protein